MEKIIPPLEFDGPMPRETWKNRPGFNIVSLDAWLKLAAQCHIPHVPAEKIATVSVDTLLGEPNNPAQVKLMAELDAAKMPNTILRWDVCASYEVKASMSAGRCGWSEDFNKYFHCHEPRTLDLIYEYPAEEMPIWRRPWVEAAIIERYPVEYRAIVHKGRVWGVSNYYIQRPLVDTSEVRADVGVVIAFTRRLLKAMPLPLAFQSHADGLDPNIKAFTADFMRLTSGEIVFLEAGPPIFEGGADPCCFVEPERGADFTIGEGDDAVLVALDTPKRRDELKQAGII